MQIGKKNKIRPIDYGQYPIVSHSHLPPIHTPSMLADRLSAGMNVPDDLIIDIEESGAFFGLEKRLGKGYYVGKKAGDDGNIIVTGINGSGKSSVFAKGTIETWRDPFVVLDIKGELSSKYRCLKKEGRVTRPSVVFDLENPKMSYNVYAMLNRDDPHFVQYVNEIVYAIIPKPPNLDEQSFWIDKARNILAGAIIYFFDRGYSFIDTMIEIQTTSVKELCKKIIRSSQNEADKNILALSFLSDVSTLKAHTIAGIGAELKRHTLVFATDPFIQTVLDNDLEDGELPFSWHDVLNSENPANVFLCLPQDKLEQWGVAIRLMLTQLIRTLERRPDKHSPKGRNCQPILILLDEFPMLGKMDIITGALTTLRSKNVTFCLIIQSLAQLDLAYGELVRKIIVDNCQYKVFLKTTEPDSQKYFSDMLGTVQTMQRSFSENYDLATGRLTYSRQMQEIRDNLIQPCEFSMNEDVWLHAPQGFFPVMKLPVAVTRLNVHDFDNVIADYPDLRGKHFSDRMLREYGRNSFVRRP